MNLIHKQKLLLNAKGFAKKFIEYTLEDDCKTYRIRHTGLKLRFSLEKKFQKNWADIPVQDNKIVFSNYMGSGYGCNGKYVTEALLKTPGRYHIVWVVKNVEEKRSQFPKEVELVEYLSPEAFAAYASAKVWVCNYHMIKYLNQGLQKKPEQTYIQLWHGSFGIKKIEGDCKVLTKDSNWLYLARKNAAITDYWISNSVFETNVYRQAFWNVKTVLEFGHPRNDLFFRENKGVSEKVRKTLGMPDGQKLLLFVPTFRDEDSDQGAPLDGDGITDALKKRFGGEWSFLVRLHPRMVKDHKPPHLIGNNLVDATAYPDIQELLLAADAVVTDYSSCIFDFLLTGRPGFLYVPDEGAYDDMRGMYYPLSATPFPFARSNEEMQENIINFNIEQYEKKTADFLQGKGSVEDGNASFRVKNLIDEIIDHK